MLQQSCNYKSFVGGNTITEHQETSAPMHTLPSVGLSENEIRTVNETCLTI